MNNRPKYNPFKNQVTQYRPTIKDLIPSEDDEQITLVQFLSIKKLPHFHPRNEGIHKVQYMKKSKVMGVYSGVPDLFVFLPHKFIAIELKRRSVVTKTGKVSTSHTSVSDNQREWIDTINCYEYANATVCYGATEAIEFIKSEMGWK